MLLSYSDAMSVEQMAPKLVEEMAETTAAIMAAMMVAMKEE